MKTKEADILEKTKSFIVRLRQNKKSTFVWPEFKEYVENNITELIRELDTRWLVSIADTYVDYGGPIESRNALLISTIANFEKLWGTYLYMYDIKINEHKRSELIKSSALPLWDGMYTFNINKGDMSNNLFTRIDHILKDTPELKLIFDTIILRLNNNETVLGDLNSYHRNFYGIPPKRSAVNSLIKKVRIFLKQYKLPLL